MKKTFLQKLVLVFSFTVILIYGAIYACGSYEETSSTDLTNFAPEAYVNSKYAPLFMSDGLFYSDDNLSNPSSRFTEDVIADWAKYLKGKVSPEEIGFFFSDKNDFANLYDYYSSHKKNEAYTKWSSKIAIDNKKVKAFIEFLYYSKPIESSSVTTNSWDYEDVDKKRFEDLNWIKSIEGKYYSTNDSFLKNRYWFQVVKAYFYSVNTADAIPFFEKTAASQPKNTLYYRAVSYLAGIHSRNQNYVQANYLYSLVFANCDKLRQVAILCFHPQEENVWEEIYKLTKNNSEKTALWAIRGYYNQDEEKSIENIFALDPKSEYLEFLLTRLVNHQEMNINKINSSQNLDEYAEVQTDTMSKTAVALIDRIAQSGKITNSHLWNSAAGYLQTLNGNYQKADSYFSKAEKKLPNTSLAINQLRILRFVNNLSKINDQKNLDFKTVITDLNWLYFELPSAKIEKFRYVNATNWSKIYIAKLFENQKNPLMSELFVHNKTFFHDDALIWSLKEMINKQNKTPIEEIGFKVYNIKLEAINQYQAIVATFQDSIPKAIDLMKQTNDLQATVFYGNPFNGNIKDCHDCDFRAYQKRKYSQMDFLLVIQSMEEKIAKNEDVYTNAMLLGNAFYNITYYGNGRIFYQTEIIGFNEEPYSYDDQCKELITNCSLAVKYYQKALEAASNNEQKAKMQYMLAKCERNDFYNTKYKTIEDTWKERDTIDFSVWNGFKNLQKDYAKTKFYQEVIAECGYFKTYIAQSKRR